MTVGGSDARDILATESAVEEVGYKHRVFRLCNIATVEAIFDMCQSHSFQASSDEVCPAKHGMVGFAHCMWVCYKSSMMMIYEIDGEMTVLCA